MSSIKDLFEVYKAKAKDEQKFVDKHVTIKHKDANGNGDDVFDASNVKPVDRKKTRLGYNPGEDEKVYEETENLEELSTKTLDSYRNKARKEIIDADANDDVGTYNKRLKGYTNALKSIRKNFVKGIDEETETLELTDEQIAAAITEMAELEGITLTEEQLNELVGTLNPITTKFFKGSKKGSKAYLKGHPESPQNKKMLRLLTKTQGLREEAEDDTEEKNEMAQTQLHFIRYAAREILEYIDMGGEIEEWYQNKLSKVHSDMESLHSYIEGVKRKEGMVKEEAELDEGIKEKIKGAIRREKAKDMPLVQNRRDYAATKAGEAYEKGDEKTGRRYMAWREKSLRKEEVEQIDEISASLAGRYIVKSRKDETARREHGLKVRDELRKATGKNFGTPIDRKLYSPVASRGAGQKVAMKKLTGQARINATEEVEQVDEILKSNTPMATWIKDFEKSDAPQFKGKSKEKRREMAIAAKLSAERGGKPLDEEIEQIDELSKKTLGSYVTKAARSAASNVAGAVASGMSNGNKEDQRSMGRTYAKRLKGVDTAAKKLSKEDVINTAIDKYIPEEVKLTVKQRFEQRLNDVPEFHKQAVIDLFNSLSEDNQKIMLHQLDEEDGIVKLLNFVIENRKA